MTDGRSRRTRRVLLLGGAHRFATYGYHGTSVSGILSAVDGADQERLTKGALYFHFASKYELALELVRESILSWTAVAAAATAPAGPGGGHGDDPLSVMLRLCDAAAAMAMYDPVTRAAWRIRGEHGSFTEALAAADVAELARITELLAAARSIGVVDPQLEPSWAAEHVITVFAGHRLRSEESAGGGDDLWARLTAAWRGLLPAVASSAWVAEWLSSGWSHRPRPSPGAYATARRAGPASPCPRSAAG